MDALAESAFETIGVEQPHRGGDRVGIDLAHHLDVALCRAATLDQRALVADLDRSARRNVLCVGTGGFRQRVHRLLGWRTIGERPESTPQRGLLRGAHGRHIGAADVGRVRRHRGRPNDRPCHLAGDTLCSAQAYGRQDAPGLSVLDRHANDCRGQAFIGWFGPRGLATIVFAVLVLDEKLPGNDTIMLAAGWTVLLNVIAHGVTANPLVKRIAGRSLGRDRRRCSGYQVRMNPMSPGIPPGYSRTSALSPKPSGLR
jgi:hypothetical protein